MPNEAKMPLQRRFDILLQRSATNIPLARRRRLLNLAEELYGPAITDGRIRDLEELFYMLGAEAIIAMSNYADQIQAEVGAAIIEEAFRDDHQGEVGSDRQPAKPRDPAGPR